MVGHPLCHKEHTMRTCKTQRQCQHTYSHHHHHPPPHHHQRHHLPLPPCGMERFVTHTHIIIIIIIIIIILPSPLWNGTFCTQGCKTHRDIPGLMSTHTSSPTSSYPSPLWNGPFCALNTQKHTRVTHIIITIIILPSPLWNGAFCALGRSFHVACFVMSAHDAVANRTQFVGPAFHGETIPWGGTAALTKRGTGTYTTCAMVWLSVVPVAAT